MQNQTSQLIFNSDSLLALPPQAAPSASSLTWLRLPHQKAGARVTTPVLICYTTRSEDTQQESGLQQP